MTMQEMSTAVQYRLPIKIFILNNEYMGMVRQWQQLLHGNRLSESYMESLPDFVKLAEAYGGVGIRTEKPSELDDAIKEMISVDKPVLFDCRVNKLANCFPMIPSGQAHNQMLLGDEPELQEVSDEGKILVKPRACRRVGAAGSRRQPCGMPGIPTSDKINEKSRTDRKSYDIPSWSTTNRACWRASSACSPAGATTSTR